MGSMRQVFIKEKADAGEKYEVKTADGKDTGEWLIVGSVYSDAFEQANRKLIEETLLEKKEDKPIRDKTNDLISAVIFDWSFDEELNEENAIEFLVNAPHIAKDLNRLIADNKFHFEKKPQS